MDSLDDSVWDVMLTYIDAIVKEHKHTYYNYMQLYDCIVKHCTYLPTTAELIEISRQVYNEKEILKHMRGGQLFFKLKTYLTSHCNNLLEQGADLTNEDLLRFYITEWKTYLSSAKSLHIACSYLNRYWVKRHHKMFGIDECDAVMEIFNLAIVIWKDTFFNKYNTQLVNTAITLLHRLRQGDLIETTLIRQLAYSYEIMGINHDAGTPSLLLYKDHFEKQFLDISYHFYVLESADFWKDKSVMEYLKKVDEWLQAEVKISMYLHPSTEQILIKNVEQSVFQKHLHEFLVEFRELLKLDKNDDLRLMYLLVNRNPEYMGKFIEEFQNFVHCQGLLHIETCGEVVKCDPKMYVNAILEVYKKYSNTLLTVFNNNLKFKIAFESACSKFVNRNFATQEPNGVRKSSELINKFCDQLMKNSNTSDLNDLDQGLEDVIILYRFIIDKDVFEEYYVKLFSKRVLNLEHRRENFEFSMISKLKRESGVAYTSRLEKMLHEVVLSKEMTQDFDNNYNTGKSTIDFNIMVLKLDLWPFRMSSSPKYTLPLELEKCVSEFSTYYSLKHTTKQLIWFYKLCKGEIVSTGFKNCYTFQASHMQIVILLLFNISNKWSLSQIYEQTKIEMELIVQILKILLKIKIVICENPKILTPDTVVSLNEFYNNKMHRININVSLKLEIDHDQETENKGIDQQRDDLTQAKIVQIMKRHKTLNYRELIEKVAQELSSKFITNIGRIKKIIELLVQKEYLQRNSNKDIYTYVA